ncbi:MAG: YggS family pyridoxal phosphate-dependent enzyme [Brevinema sp.]
MLSKFQEIVYNINANRCSSQNVVICAVGKTQPAELIQEAINMGISEIGENRVQEAAEKFPLITGARRHLIGPLQSNKENAALKLFDVIQSIESVDQCRRLCTKIVAADMKKVFYIQVNTSEEPQKHGVENYAELTSIAREAIACPNVVLEGLMTIGALEGAPRICFKKLRTMRDTLQDTLGIPLGLSMGMSGDYITAVQEGATLLRIGSLLFGKRI